MSVTFHDVTKSATWTNPGSPFTFSHAGVSPRAFLLFLHQQGTGAAPFTSAAYGGVSLTKIGEARDTAGEPGVMELWFVGASVPAGTQTVSIAHTNTSALKQAIAVTLNANMDCEVLGFATLTEDQADPNLVINTGAREGLRFSALMSGIADEPALQNVAGMTRFEHHDAGVRVERYDRQNAASTGSFDMAIDTAGVVEDVAFFAFAVAELAPSAGIALITQSHTVTASGVDSQPQVNGAQILVPMDMAATVRKEGGVAATVSVAHTVTASGSGTGGAPSQGGIANLAVPNSVTAVGSKQVGGNAEILVLALTDAEQFITVGGEGGSAFPDSIPFSVVSDNMAVHHMRQGDTDPPFRTQLLDANRQAVDLTGATVEFHVSYERSNIIKFAAAATPDPDQSETGSRGFVDYDFITGDTDIAGRFWCEWQVTFADGDIQTFPTRGHDQLLVYGQVA